MANRKQVRLQLIQGFYEVLTTRNGYQYTCVLMTKDQEEAVEIWEAFAKIGYKKEDLRG